MCNFKPIKVLFFILLTPLLYGDSFERNCESCHFQQMQLQIFMSKYTLKYSSQDKIEKAIFKYLKNPTQETSVMPFGFLNRFGIKDKTFLKDVELQKSINEYYKRYNLKQFIN